MVCGRATELVAVTWAMTCAAFVTVALRIYMRFTVIHIFGYDDMVILLALVFTIVMTYAMNAQAHYGLGEHIEHLQPQNVENIYYWFYISVIFYNGALGLVKLSMLLQYLTIFSLLSLTRIATIFGIVFNAAFMIETAIVSIFACWPIDYFWHKNHDGACVNFKAMWLSHAVVNIATDLYIILVPLPAISKIRLPIRQKITLIFVFSLGSSVCVASILRLSSIELVSTSRDVTYDNIDAAIWSCVELCLAIICASLPVFKTFLGRWFPRLYDHFIIPLSSGNQRSANQNTNRQSTIAPLPQPMAAARPSNFREYNYESFRSLPESVRESQENPSSQSIRLEEPYPSMEAIPIRNPRPIRRSAIPVRSSIPCRSLTPVKGPTPGKSSIPRRTAAVPSFAHLSQLERGEYNQSGFRKDSSVPTGDRKPQKDDGRK
ncbi:uncharacterized protein J3D65DRAFT_444777 [Phyllosticta citribraziliensis]|uniref:Rhodopsin domain-containing protein n=1 Tax=Phyllosticta citribraziliensis TaxID=989973 RepID=A0ABR1LJ33_9PEZI